MGSSMHVALKSLMFFVRRSRVVYQSRAQVNHPQWRSSSAAIQRIGRIRTGADIRWRTGSARSVENDPQRKCDQRGTRCCPDLNLGVLS